MRIVDKMLIDVRTEEEPKMFTAIKKKRRVKSKSDSPGDVNKGPSASASFGVKDISTNSGTNTILIQENTGTAIKMQAQQPQQMQFPHPRLKFSHKATCQCNYRTLPLNSHPKRAILITVFNTNHIGLQKY